MTDADFARRALALIDLTDLSDDCTPERIAALAAKARRSPVPVAALCIWPEFLTQARAALGDASPIRLATVVNFPQGGENVAQACAETRRALEDGADEIDLVLPWRALLDDRETIARDLVRAVADVASGRGTLKVILETGELKTPERIAQASALALENGADFLKTSTGKTPVSATPEAARVMLTAIRDSRSHAGFKASGGLRTLDQARLYLALADEIMGAGWADARRFRFGASALFDPLLAAAEARA